MTSERKGTVYLAGGINGLSDEEVFGWRRTAARSLGRHFEILDPAGRDYRGIEARNADELVTRDLADIARADWMLARADRPSWGTAMEIFFAHSKGVRVAAFGAGDKPSPWLMHHAELRASLEDAIAFLISRIGT